jgi:hypothetical protein
MNTLALRAHAAGNHEFVIQYLRKIMAGFVGCTDFPAWMYVPELLEVYPDAKVVLVERDPDEWFESLRAILQHGTGPIWSLLVLPHPGLRWWPAFVREWLKQIQRVLDARGGTWGPGEWLFEQTVILLSSGRSLLAVLISLRSCQILSDFITNGLSRVYRRRNC